MICIQWESASEKSVVPVFSVSRIIMKAKWFIWFSSNLLCLKSLSSSSVAGGVASFTHLFIMILRLFIVSHNSSQNKMFHDWSNKRPRSRRTKNVNRRGQKTETHTGQGETQAFGRLVAHRWSPMNPGRSWSMMVPPVGAVASPGLKDCVWRRLGNVTF